MTFNELNKVNSESAFRESRMHQLKSILLLLTVGGFIIVLLWQMFDKYYLKQTESTLFWLRVITVAVYFLNFSIAFIRKTDKAYKQHLTAGFYFGTIFCMLLAMFTGASQSPYWFGLFFILIGWFVLVPFNYKELIIHSLMFFVTFMAGLFAQTEYQLIDYEIAKMVFLYSGTLFIGFYAAYRRNSAEAESYLSNKALKAKNKELNKFLLVLEQAPGSVFIMDNKMNFEYINPVFTQLSGYTEDDLLHKNINDTIYKGKTPESRADAAQALLKGEKWQGELLTYHKTGENYWANTIAAPYKDESGNVEGFVVIQQDITQRKKMELALRESEQLYRTLIERSLDGVSLTVNRRFSLVNQALCDMVGYTMEEILVIDPTTLLAPDDRERVLALHDKRMAGEMDSLHYTAKFIHKSGKLVMVEMNSTTVQVNGKNASFTTSRDITENRNMEIALRESEQLYRTLIERSLDGVALTVNRRFSLVNQALCDMVGYTMEEILAIDPTALLAPEDRERVLALHDKRMAGEMDSLHYTAKFIHKSGKLLMVEMNSTTVQVSGQNASFVTLRDITEQNTLKEALELSVQKYRDLADLLPQTVYELDIQGKIVFMNQAGINAFGKVLPSNELFALDFIAPEDHQRLIQNIQASYQGKKPDSGSEYTALRADGSRYPIMVYSTPVFTNGVQTGTRGIIIDISERKAIENALRESESKYKTLVENSQDGILIIRDDKVLFANNTIAKALGYSIDEFYQIPSINLLHPDDRYKAAKIAIKRHNHDFTPINEEFRMIAKNGEVKDCETSSTLIEFDGQWASFFTIQDITESKRMQTELKENEEKYRQLFEAESDAIFMIDADTGEILDANPATTLIYGYSHNELLLMKNTDVSAEPEKTSEATQKHLNLVPVRFHKKKDGTVFPVELSAGFTKVGNRNIQIVTSRDITERIQNQEAIRISELKYRELTEMLPQAIYEHDLNGNLTFLNQAGKQKFGIDTLEPAISAFTLVTPEDIERMRKNMSESLSRNITSRGNMYTAIRSNGEKFPVMIFASPMISESKMIGIRGILIDMTEHVAMENALRESEKKYRELTEMLPQAIYELDAQGNPIYLNKAGLKIFGIEKGTAGKKAFDFFIPEDMQRMKQALKMEAARMTTDEGVPESIPSDPMEFTAQRPDGSRFPVLIYGTSVIENGEVVGSRGMIIDISERKAMENAIRESESKYKTLIENSQDGVFAIIGDKIEFVNSTLCKMLGYSAEELYKMPAINMVVPEDRQRGSEISRRRLNGDWSTVNGIFHFLAKDGSIKECDTFSSVLELNGQIVSYLTVHDLTENRRMQEQLQLSEEKYRTVIDNATDGIVITQQGKLKFVNASMCEMLQFTEEELIELPFLNLVVEEDQQVMIDYHKRRMAGEDFTSLYRSHIKRKDGSIVTVELNSRTSAYNGSPAAFIIIRDISDRERIENELQTAKRNLEMLNRELEQRVIESSESLTEARTQLINLQKENLQSQFDVLKQQVNPHFLFNSLNVLTSLIKLEPDLAEKFSEHLSKVYRYVLENKDNELVDLNTELVFLDAYIFLLNIRFVNKLKVHIDIPEIKRSYRVIPLAMQLLIENAIKHNIMSKSNPLQIDIFIDSDNFLNIVNNLQERPSQIISTGVGLKNIQNRYLLLNNTEPVFEKTDTHFIAKVPLITTD